MRPKGHKLSATTTEQTLDIGAGLKAILIRNDGADDVLVEFDRAIGADSYLLKDGESLTIEYPFIRLFYKANSSTATLYILKIIQ